LTLVATGVKLVAYAPGRMKAAEKRRARHLQLAEPVFRLFGVPKRGDAFINSTIEFLEKESDGEDDSAEIRTKEFRGGCPRIAEGY